MSLGLSSTGTCSLTWKASSNSSSRCCSLLAAQPRLVPQPCRAEVQMSWQCHPLPPPRLLSLCQATRCCYRVPTVPLLMTMVALTLWRAAQSPQQCSQQCFGMVHAKQQRLAGLESAAHTCGEPPLGAADAMGWGISW